jgi:hypothetical protein
MMMIDSHLSPPPAPEKRRGRVAVPELALAQVFKTFDETGETGSSSLKSAPAGSEWPA